MSALSRPRGQDAWLVTAFVKNITPRSTGVELDQRALFQTDIRVRVVSPDGRGAVVAYPDHLDASAPNQSGEDASLELLYRHAKTFAIGHGCAGDWQADSDGERASVVVASMLPVVETASVTPDVYYPRDTRLRVSMAKLAGLDASDDGFASVDAMLDGYEDWISKLRPDEVPGHLVSVSRDHVDKCTAMLTRMRRGLDFIRTDPAAGRAFKLANGPCSSSSCGAGAIPGTSRLTRRASSSASRLKIQIGRRSTSGATGGRSSLAFCSPPFGRSPSRPMSTGDAWTLCSSQPEAARPRPTSGRLRSRSSTADQQPGGRRHSGADAVHAAPADHTAVPAGIGVDCRHGPHPAAGEDLGGKISIGIWLGRFHDAQPPRRRTRRFAGPAIGARAKRPTACSSLPMVRGTDGAPPEASRDRGRPAGLLRARAREPFDSRARTAGVPSAAGCQSS